MPYFFCTLQWGEYIGRVALEEAMPLLMPRPSFSVSWHPPPTPGSRKKVAGKRKGRQPRISRKWLKREWERISLLLELLERFCNVLRALQGICFPFLGHLLNNKSESEKRSRRNTVLCNAWNCRSWVEIEIYPRHFPRQPTHQKMTRGISTR